MRVNVGQAKTDLSKLLARVEAGEEVVIARDGDPVARLVAIEERERPGEKFLERWGSHRGQFVVGEDFEFSDEEIDELFHGG